MESSTDGRSSSDNPLLIGMVREGLVELDHERFVVPGQTRVHVRGVRARRGSLICRVIAAAPAGDVVVASGEFVIASAYFPARLLVRDQAGKEFLAFADEVSIIGRRATADGAARLRALVGDPLR